jgi:hypothetical protein
VVLFFLGQSDMNEAARTCPSYACASPTALSTAQDADDTGARKKTIGLVLAGAGAVLVGGGLTWFFVQPASATGKDAGQRLRAAF